MESIYLNYFINEYNPPFFTQIYTQSTDFRMHTHQDFYELVVILNGSAMHIVDGEQFFIKKGDVFVINDKTSHGYIHTNELEICNIMFQPEYFFSNLKELRKLSGFHALFVLEPLLTQERNFTSRLKLSTSDFLTVKSYIHMLLSEFECNRDGRDDMIKSIFIIIAIFLSRNYDMTALNPEDLLLQIADSVSYIENNFTKNIHINDLAKMSGLSTRHFNRLFKSTYKTTPSRYLLNLRLDMASNLLITTNKPVTEIALLAGFYDSNYFSRAFKKYRNTSPSIYRKNKATS